MQLKRHDLLPSLSLSYLLSLLVYLLSLLGLAFLAFIRQSVEVRAYDAFTGDPLLHAVVESAFPAQRQATSAGWLFWDVNRRLSVSVTAAGYLPAEASWRATYPWVRQGHLDVPLAPAQLTGIVRNAETARPLPGTEVWIGPEKLVADAAGMFHLSGLTGDTPVSAKLDGYDLWQGQVLWKSHLLRRELLTLDLSPNTVGGQVRWRETGDPLPGVTVTTIDQQQITDQQGRFFLRRLREGDIVNIEREGFRPVQVVYMGQPLEVGLTPHVVEGRVYWPEIGEPLTGATVVAGEQQQVTDEFGRFRLSQLQVGDIITVARDGFWPAEVVFTGGFSEIDVTLQDRRVRVMVRSALEGVELSGLEVTRGGQSLAVASPETFDLRACTEGELLQAKAYGHWPAQARLGPLGEQSMRDGESIEMVLQPRVLTVTVRDDYSNWPLIGAVVQSSPAKRTDAQGQAVLAPAMPGMTIAVGLPGYVRQTLRYEGGSPGLEVRLVPRVVRGTVVDASTGEPVAGVALRQDGHTLTRTASDGSFSLEGGAWRPAFKVRMPGYHLTQVTIGDPASPVVPRSCSGSGDAAALCWEIQLLPFEVRGVYMPFGLLHSRQRVMAILDMISRTELNAVVVDVKGDRGWLAYSSELPLAKELDVMVEGLMDIHEFLDICRQRGIYTIARLVVFKDNPLAHGKLDLAVKKADDTVWLDGEELGWANPHSETVWDYNIGIAKEVAQLGFDEIQLDYVRFPSDGDLSKIVYEEEDTLETKTTAIRTFVARMQEALEPYDVFLSVDVFGMTLTVDPQNDLGIGQRVIDIAPYVDYLCPMVYPSTWPPGSLGLANPPLHPNDVVETSLRRGMAHTSTLIRPWLQAYSLYGVEYGLERQSVQRRAAETVGACGWTYWNAGGQYDEGLFGRRADDNVVHLDDEGKPGK